MTVFILLIALLFPSLAAGQQQGLAPPTGYVNDRAGMFSPETVVRLETFLRDFERSDSTQIVVLTVPSLEGEPVETYALRVAEEWKIGQKGKDNGALLLVARDDRKIRIEVGYGLEGRLTDLLAGRIVDNEIAPRFKAGDFDAGVLAGVQAMAEAVRGEYKGTGRARQKERSPWGLLALLFFLGPGLMLLGGGSRRGYRGHHRRGGFWIGGPPFGGGGFGGGGGFSGGGGGFGGGGSSGGW